MKNFVLDRQLHNFPRWKHPLHLAREVGPLFLSPKIIDHQKAAGQQVFPQCLDFVLAEVQLARLDDVNERVLEQFVLGEIEHRALGIDLECGELLQAKRHVQVALRPVDRPFAATAPTAAAP